MLIQWGEPAAGLLCISDCVTCPVICSPPPPPLLYYPSPIHPATLHLLNIPTTPHHRSRRHLHHHPHHHQLYHSPPSGRHMAPSFFVSYMGHSSTPVYNFNTPNGQAPTAKGLYPYPYYFYFSSKGLFFFSPRSPFLFIGSHSMLSTSCSSCKRDRYSMVRSLLVN
ncbi:hypothetical protein NC653_018029 [Populus alba x Populus x berolinensis]|uniref:Uncharacterized protein n=1 Tax=Populus alba x Populus x berolinensis TaxID=444605 RepID=A0AAD6QSK2_9ROSI|nr:hypothetical protein NC653_018029 [Populus alba x Populus x berolinensis]